MQVIEHKREWAYLNPAVNGLLIVILIYRAAPLSKPLGVVTLPVMLAHGDCVSDG